MDRKSAVETFLDNNKLRDEMGRNGRSYVVNKNSWEVIAQEIGKTCKTVIRHHDV